MSETERCKFIGNEGAGFDSETEDDGVITCTDDAQVVVRLKNPLQSSKGLFDAMKTPVCQRHGGWLQESDEVERNWEICSTIEDWGEENDDE